MNTMDTLERTRKSRVQTVSLFRGFCVLARTRRLSFGNTQTARAAENAGKFERAQHLFNAVINKVSTRFKSG